MLELRPIKRVRFQEVSDELSDVMTSEYAPTANLCNVGTSRLPLLPTAQEIYKWTSKDEATAPCFVRDVLSMRESSVKGPNTHFYWLGHIPCRRVLVVGIVVGIDVSQNWTLYTVDDSTAVIECLLSHPLPFAHLDQKSRWQAAKSNRLLNAPPSPPPDPVTAIGYPVQVIGKVALFHGERQIKAVSIKPCESTNDQWKHILNVVELHKSKYAVPKPFQIPASDKLQARSSLKRPRPADEPSSPLAHSPTSVPSSLVISGSLDPPIFLHPSQLRTADLTDKTFQSYLEHFIFNAEPDVPTPPTGPTGVTLSHLRRIPELALLASLVVTAETKRRDRASAEAEIPRQSTKTDIRPRFGPSPPSSRSKKMKNLFKWAIVELYNEGRLVLCDNPIPLTSIPVHTTTANSALLSSPHASSSKSVLSAQDGLLSDPPPYEEDEAYVSVTPELLAGPVLEILRAKGITGKTAAVGADQITRELKRSCVRWAQIRTRAVEETLDIIIM